jgi:glycosyltransferase involved in cell wall biosynthesis
VFEQANTDGDGMTARQEARLPLLSVIIPVFNEQALLEDHLRQIVAYLQTVENEFRWEIVIVNDGSLDNSTAITERFAGRYEKLRFGAGYTVRLQQYAW